MMINRIGGPYLTIKSQTSSTHRWQNQLSPILQLNLNKAFFFPGTPYHLYWVRMQFINYQMDSGILTA